MYRVFPPDFFFVKVVTPTGWLDNQLTQLHDGGALDVTHPDIVPDMPLTSANFSSIHFP
jgi:hypothetical protein